MGALGNDSFGIIGASIAFVSAWSESMRCEMGNGLYSRTKRKVFSVIICLLIVYVAIGVGIVVRGMAMMDSSSMLEVLHVSTRLALAGNQTDCTMLDGFFLGNFCKEESAVRGNICGCEVVKYNSTYTLLENILKIFYLTHPVNLITPVSEFFGSKIIAKIPRYAYEDRRMFSIIVSSIKDPRSYLDNYRGGIVSPAPLDIGNDRVLSEKYTLDTLRRVYSSMDVYIVVVEDDNDEAGRVVDVVSANLR